MIQRISSILAPCIFVAGLAVVGWIGAGYLGTSLLGVAVVLLIAACYLAGAMDLRRHRAGTAALGHALDEADGAIDLPAWLARLPEPLRQPVRLRIEDGPGTLPAPALAPSLSALLVLLGMLGTLLGMMATLRGTGLALGSALDLEAIRGSLSTPVHGLAIAFGTSIAGVGASAALGLLTTLARRERLQAAQRLDAAIAGPLRMHTRAHRREQAFDLLQRQADLMPALVDRLQAMTQAIEQQAAASSAQLQARQDAFHAEVERSYTALAASVGQSLAASVAEGSRAVADSLQPVVAETLAGMARETDALRQTVSQSVELQLAQLASGFETASARAADSWRTALAAQQQSNAALAAGLSGVFERAAEAQEQRAAGLLDGVASRMDAMGAAAAAAWTDAAARQQAAGEALAQRNEAALAAAASGLERQGAGLVAGLRESADALQATLAAGDEARLSAWSERLDALSSELARRWGQAGEDVASQQRTICDMLARTATGIAAQQAALAQGDEARLSAWSERLDALSSELARRWGQAGEDVAARQQAICDTLERTATSIAARSQAHADATIAEVSRLVQTASEAPRAAAEVIAELRQSLSDSMVRDTAMLEERTRMLATLETLLDAVNHASGEQRAAVDALVASSADLLERTGTRLSERIDAEADHLDAAAAQLTGSAVEVASLGDAFAAAVDSFGAANESMLERLQQVATALDGSMARSDEQLAYYVAQAREVVELSVSSQQQIVAGLQRVAGAAEAAPA